MELRLHVKRKNNMELLAPAGNFEKLKTAFYYGADACYLGGKQFGLRALSDNFDYAQLKQAVDYAHNINKKIYVTVNILAHNTDFDGLQEYVEYLQKISVDGVIVSDIGIMQFVKQYAPKLELHVSTQANITNKFSAKTFCDYGAKRLVLARELSLKEIKEIREFIPKDVEIECFVHGAMCISYSGRCLLSNYLTGRDSNRGACVQACRWQYYITEKSRADKCNGCSEQYEIQEDDRGTYILNSKDLNMIEYLQELEDAGVGSLKIEGRMKSPYYVATVVNAYRRALDYLTECRQNGKEYILSEELKAELEKASHRRYTTGFYFGAKDKEYLETSMPIQTHEFMAYVLGESEVSEDKNFKHKVLVEMRNRFKVGDTLEILSPSENFNKTITVQKMTDEFGKEITDASLVQQKLYLYSNYKLQAGDILRK